MEIDIAKYLVSKGFECSNTVFVGLPAVVVKTLIHGNSIELLYLLEEEISSIPHFYLVNPQRFGKIAHVRAQKLSEHTLGFICVNDRDSISVNFARPELAIKESLDRHINILTRAISDSDWNEKELIREFYTNWNFICDKSSPELFVSCNEPTIKVLTVYSPEKNAKYGIRSKLLAELADNSLAPFGSFRRSIIDGNRGIAGIAYILPLESLISAPEDQELLSDWYTSTIDSLPENYKREFSLLTGQLRSKNYWIVFTAKIDEDNRTWFSLKLRSESKRTLPLSIQKLNKWKLKASSMRMLNFDNVLKRGGASTELGTKKVALFGAGSVGSELAHKISASGVCKLDVFDADTYDVENLYRHILPETYIGISKSHGLSWRLQDQFPWSQAKPVQKELLNVIKEGNIKQYDLIVIAIGRPTHELLFKQYLLDNDILVPVINCWVEGFGVGGHAILDIPESKGCTLCAYTCQESGGRRGLVSNLNFIEENQTVAKNMAGCGEQFISYGAICSAQTALIAADLTIKFLEGKIKESCKVSWRGEEDDALREDIFLTHRYYNFKENILRLPLYDKDCDVCNG